MPTSVFQLFKIGIGPSASHTLGPMRAARLFLEQLVAKNQLHQVAKVQVELYGSLALTGIGHRTDKALLLGLAGYEASTLDPDQIETILATIGHSQSLALLGKQRVDFVERRDLRFFRRKSLPLHPNGMVFLAHNADAQEIDRQTYYSFGGGFVATAEEAEAAADKPIEEEAIPYPFSSGKELLELCIRTKLSMAQLIEANERFFHSQAELEQYLDKVWQTMDACIERGMRQSGVLPGPLQVKRRAAAVHANLNSLPEERVDDPLTILDWVNLYALAVNEENASGARVVTAPTNGAAGVIPAVIRYYLRFCSGNIAGVRTFLLTATAIGTLYRKNASISGAEVGCQGEVGVACSMAAAGLVAVLGGTPLQVEQAAEIAMEHNLGLTCDPIGGLVQIPCIERNAMGAVKAINAARLAQRGDGLHFVSLDSVIATMYQTGRDMMTKYKETSRGGLAVNVIEC